MPSPFPGMDPYLEKPGFWRGFHTRLYNAISEALNAKLPEGYFAEIDEYVWLQADDSEKRTHRYVKIVDADQARVITVIEVLSPANKEKSEDREKYLDKRGEYRGSGTNLVEIDLLRGGVQLPLGKPSLPNADYYLFVCRGSAYPHADVWPFTLRAPIPSVPIPLKPEHPDTLLDLQSHVTEIYDVNCYAMRIDYSQSVTPALRKPDAEWATELQKKHNKKRKK